MSWQRPSVGFSMVVATYTLSVAFFAWGLSTPPLDRVWQLHHELKIGRTWKLSKEDRRLLLSSMAAHPALAQSLLDVGQAGIISANRDGWIDTPHVTIVRTPRSPLNLRLVLDIQTPPEHIPFEIEIDGSDWERELSVQARGTLSVELPPPPNADELVTFKIKGDELRADPSSLGVRITFDPPPDGAESRDDEEEEDE
jgi:hypothetical protein